MWAWYVQCGAYTRQLVLRHDTDVKGRVSNLKWHQLIYQVLLFTSSILIFAGIKFCEFCKILEHSRKQMYMKL